MSEADDYERRFQQREKRRRITGWLLRAVLGAVFLGPFAMIGKRCYDESAAETAREEASKLDASDLARLGPLVAKAEQRVSSRATVLAKQVTKEALAALQPGHGRCATSLQAPTAQAAQSYVMYSSIDGNYFGSWSYRLVTAGAEVRSGAIDWARHYVEDGRKALDEKTGEKDTLAQVEAIAEDRYFQKEIDVFVMVESQKEPVFLGDTFSSGMLVGRAYLYSHADERVACAADLRVENSETIDFQYLTANVVHDNWNQQGAAQGALTRDMEVQIRRAIASGLLSVESAPN